MFIAYQTILPRKLSQLSFLCLKELQPEF